VATLFYILFGVALLHNYKQLSQPEQRDEYNEKHFEMFQTLTFVRLKEQDSWLFKNFLCSS